MSLRSSKDFRAVYEKGVSAVSRELVVFALKREDAGDSGKNRVGVSISKKFGGAVARNKARRLVKEAYGKLEPRIEEPYDLVVLVRPAARGKSFFRITEALRDTLKKGGLLRNQDEETGNHFN